MQCFACGKELKHVLAHVDEQQLDGRRDPNQCRDAVEIWLTGGYGMLIDPGPEEGQPHVLICKDCSVQLCETVSWMQKVLGPYVS